MNLLNTTKRMLVVTLLFVTVSGSTYAAASALRRAVHRAGPAMYGTGLAAGAALCTKLAFDEHYARETKPHVVHPHGMCRHFKDTADGKLVVQGHATRDEQADCQASRKPLPRVSL